MAEPIIQPKKEEEEEKMMDVSTEPVNNENMDVSKNADEMLNSKEVEEPMVQDSSPTPQPSMEEETVPMEISPELTFPPSSKKTRRAKCPPGCMRKPKCSSTGGKRSKKSKKTKKGGKKSRKRRKSRKSRK
jgi:hypothetical protein